MGIKIPQLNGNSLLKKMSKVISIEFVNKKQGSDYLVEGNTYGIYINNCDGKDKIPFCKVCNHELLILNNGAGQKLYYCLKCKTVIFEDKKVKFHPAICCKKINEDSRFYICNECGNICFETLSNDLVCKCGQVGQIYFRESIGYHVFSGFLGIHNKTTYAASNNKTTLFLCEYLNINLSKICSDDIDCIHVKDKISKINRKREEVLRAFKKDKSLIIKGLSDYLNDIIVFNDFVTMYLLEPTLSSPNNKYYLCDEEYNRLTALKKSNIFNNRDNLIKKDVSFNENYVNLSTIIADIQYNENIVRNENQCLIISTNVCISDPKIDIIRLDKKIYFYGKVSKSKLYEYKFNLDRLNVIGDYEFSLYDGDKLIAEKLTFKLKNKLMDIVDNH